MASTPGSVGASPPSITLPTQTIFSYPFGLSGPLPAGLVAVNATPAVLSDGPLCIGFASFGSDTYLSKSIFPSANASIWKTPSARYGPCGSPQYGALNAYEALYANQEAILYFWRLENATSTSYLITSAVHGDHRCLEPLTDANNVTRLTRTGSILNYCGRSSYTELKGSDAVWDVQNPDSNSWWAYLGYTPSVIISSSKGKGCWIAPAGMDSIQVAPLDTCPKLWVSPIGVDYSTSVLPSSVSFVAAGPTDPAKCLNYASNTVNVYQGSDVNQICGVNLWTLSSGTVPSTVWNVTWLRNSSYLLSRGTSCLRHSNGLLTLGGSIDTNCADVEGAVWDIVRLTQLPNTYMIQGKNSDGSNVCLQIQNNSAVRLANVGSNGLCGFSSYPGLVDDGTFLWKVFARSLAVARPIPMPFPIEPISCDPPFYPRQVNTADVLTIVLSSVCAVGAVGTSFYILHRRGLIKFPVRRSRNTTPASRANMVFVTGEGTVIEVPFSAVTIREATRVQAASHVSRSASEKTLNATPAVSTGARRA